MIRLGIIGTNWITDRFLDAALQTKQYTVGAVYSRTTQKAKAFAEKYDCDVTFTDMDAFSQSTAFDAVYIASPTALHAEQAITCLQGKKHVLVEKPMASNQTEVKAMIDAAKTNNVTLMEAMKTTHLPNFEQLSEMFAAIAPIRRVVGNFCQYSSRYDRYKEGEILNAFKPDLSNGSLMDIGVYTIYPIVQLFGAPKRIEAAAHMLASGVDGAGTVLLDYGDFQADLMFSKITNSGLASEVQGENGSIVIKKWSDMLGLTLIDKEGNESDISVDQRTNSMYYEADHFAELIKAGKIESDVNRFEVSLETMNVLDTARAKIGLVFPSDHK